MYAASLGTGQTKGIPCVRSGCANWDKRWNQPDTPDIRGMIHKVAHLVSVSEIEE